MSTTDDLDVDALRVRYKEERERRLRPDGIEQYRDTTGELAHFVNDPFSSERPERESVHDEVDVALIGAGFGGLLTGAYLRDLGVESIRLVDRAADVGGTWYWNRYPGVACDIESYVYLPLLEETGYVPTEKYVRGAEIFEHCQRIATQYDLYQDTLFQTSVTEVRWSEDSDRWVVRTDRGDEFSARFISLANGFLQKPKLPGIDGIEKFGGEAFHTSRWNFDFTGGDGDGGLSELGDRRVGVIGTGASAIQCVPHLADAADELFVFQRTPSSVDVRANRPTDQVNQVDDVQHALATAGTGVPTSGLIVSRP